MELIGLIVELHEIVRRACRWRNGTVEVGGQHPTERRVGSHVEVDGTRRTSGNHLRPFEGDDALAAPTAADNTAGELIDRHVVPVGPHAKFRIVVQFRERVGVPVPRPERAARRRHGDALIERAARIVRERELGHQPAIGDLVVEHDRIAVVPRLARAAESLPECLAARRPVQHGACLVVDGERKIHELNVVRRTHVAIGIGRQDPREVADSIEDRQRRDGVDRRRGHLNRRVRDMRTARPTPADRKGRMRRLVLFVFDGQRRQIDQRWCSIVLAREQNRWPVSGAWGVREGLCCCEQWGQRRSWDDQGQYDRAHSVHRPVLLKPVRSRPRRQSAARPAGRFLRRVVAGLNRLAHQ